MRQLQQRADDLAECLLVFELEMRRSRTLDKRLKAYEDFERVVDRIDGLRRDAEMLASPAAKDSMLSRLDKKVVSIKRSPAYKVAEWFNSEGVQLSWMIGPATVDPICRVTQC